MCLIDQIPEIGQQQYEDFVDPQVQNTYFWSN